MSMRMLLCLALFSTAAIGHAADVKPFEINMDRVSFDKKGKFGASTTYIIPTVYLRLTGRNQTSISNGGASAKARVFIEGVDKSFLQGLSKKVYDDLIAKMRAAGYTVLAYDDLKTELAGFDRMKPNPKYGLPTLLTDKSGTVDFVLAAPSDEQALDWGVTGQTFPYRAMAKAKNAVVIIPNIYFNTASVLGKKGGGLFSKEVSLEVDPAMRLYSATIAGMPPDAGWCNILIQEHGKRLAADVAGKIEKLDEDQSKFDTWSRTVADFAFVVDKDAVGSGVIRVGTAINDLIVATVKKAH